MDIRYVLEEHRLCGHVKCPQCQSLLKIGSFITQHAKYNGLPLVVTDAWATTAMRFVGYNYPSEQHVNHFTVAGAHVTVSSVFHARRDREWDQLFEDFNLSIRVDGVFIGTYLDALKDADGPARRELGYWGIVAWPIARHMIEQASALVPVGG